MANISSNDFWQSRKLGEMAEEVRALFEPRDAEEYPYVGLEHIERGTLQLNGIGHSTDTVSTKKQFKDGEILFGSLRPYFRKVVRPKFNGVCSTDITVIRPKKNCNAGFLHYFIANKSFIDHATNISSGTQMPRANWKTLCESEWQFPPLSTQRKIAAILSAYDDLIENNLRRIKILEGMAQNLYREWFVKFRFPGYQHTRFIDSYLGMIPDGWDVAEFRHLFEIKYGKTLPKTQIADVGLYPVYGAGDVIGYYDKALCQEKCALVTSRGNGSGTVWRTREAAFVTNNSLIILPKTELKHWDYSFVELHLMHSNVMEAKTGSAQPQVTIENLNYVKAIVPERPCVEKFSSFVTPLSEQVDLYLLKNSTLRRTRDLLLPRLISGEVDVSELDIAVSEEASA
jgi:type I restriction enzyme S subunit